MVVRSAFAKQKIAQVAAVAEIAGKPKETLTSF